MEELRLSQIFYKMEKVIRVGMMEQVKREISAMKMMKHPNIVELHEVMASKSKIYIVLEFILQYQLEYNLDQVRNQLQAAQAHTEKAESIYQQAVDGKGDAPSLAEQSRQKTQTSQMSHNFMSRIRDQSAPIMYTWQVPFTEKSCQIEDLKPAAAAVAAKLTASTSSAEMLSYAPSSLASEDLVSNPIKESSDDYSSEKRAKIENDHASYVPQNPQAPVPDLYYASTQHTLPDQSQESNPDNPPPPPPSFPPPLPPLPPMQPYPIPQYMPTAGLVPNVPYGYNTSQHRAPLPGYPPVGPPMNGVSPLGVHPSSAYQMYPTEGGLYGPTPVTRQ